MKKSILIIICLVTGLFFTGINEVTAQWSVEVYYIDVNCNCGSITDKTIEWQLKDVVTNLTISCDSTDLTGSSPFTVTGPEAIIYDAQDRYYFIARITYYDPTKCCSGWDSDTFDGDELVDDIAATLWITMN